MHKVGIKTWYTSILQAISFDNRQISLTVQVPLKIDMDAYRRQ